jgi:predicted RNA-binding Zn ribbon-like protein
VQEFVNSVDLEDGPDGFANPRLLRTWLIERGLLDERERIGADQLRRAVAVREAIRALALANNGGPSNLEAAKTLTEAVGAAPLVVRFDARGGAAIEPVAGTMDNALSFLAGLVFQAILEGTWPRLKACRRDVCHWVFYDRSKNRSSTWCAMSICGNRVKTRAYYGRRHRGPTATTVGAAPPLR